ncbi:MAG: hypothetical protein JSW11_09830 [Candidatus Heimdallarchaeota archaeon]|nr:MAG: hypothetical protein JSW11_09830 [Candidatus Heimdallarchaeota archaeon]
MSDIFSVFVVFPHNIIEICFSRPIRDTSNDSDKKMDKSQFLLVAATQFLLQVIQLKSDWKKWMFFVLSSAVGEGFRVDSCRDYPREEFTKINIEKFLINEYDLVANIQTKDCSLRIDPVVKENFFILIENHRSKILKKKITQYSLPATEALVDKIRILDLKFIVKRTTLVAPTVKEVQTWIITWNQLTVAEFKRLKTVDTKGIDIAELPPYLNNEEIVVQGWIDYRDASLEQPWGLICPTCKMTYSSNIFAKICNSCKSSLIKA